MSRERVGIIPGFHERLDQLIRDSGMSCKEIASLVGRDRKIISAYRNGDSIPDGVVIYKLCAVLKTTPNYLLLGKI